MQCGGIFPSNRMKKGISQRGNSRGKRSGQEESDALEKLDMEQEEQVLISAGRRHELREKREKQARWKAIWSGGDHGQLESAWWL